MFGGKDKSPDLKMKRKMKANFRAQKDTCWWGNVETPVQTQMRARPSREDTFSGGRFSEGWPGCSMQTALRE